MGQLILRHNTSIIHSIIKKSSKNSYELIYSYTEGTREVRIKIWCGQEIMLFAKQIASAKRDPS